MSHDTEEWCKIWRKIDFLSQNDKNLVNFDLSIEKSTKFTLSPKKVQRSYIL